jgi:hypothetical protein
MSIGLSALANISSERAFFIVARQKYGITITAIKKAIENPERVNLDRTVQTIGMLAIFEVRSHALPAIPTFNCEDPPNLTSSMQAVNQNQMLKSWLHLNGIAAIVRQFPHRLGRERSDYSWQLQLYFSVIIQYFHVGDSVPSDLLNWTSQLIQRMPAEYMQAITLINILVRFIELHSRIRCHPQSDINDVLQVAHLLEAELEGWEATLGGRWSFSIVETENLSNTCYGRYHIYRDIWAARILTHYRWARLVVNEVIYAYTTRLLSPMSGHSPQQLKALGTINKMATDICISAASQETLSGQGVFLQTQPIIPMLNGVFLMIFPLTVVASATGIPEYLHTWALSKLQSIGCTMGIQQALQIIPKIAQIRDARKDTNRYYPIIWIT